MRWIREPQALGSNSLRNLLCLKRWCFGTEEQGGEDRASKKGKRMDCKATVDAAIKLHPPVMGLSNLGQFFCVS